MSEADDMMKQIHKIHKINKLMKHSMGNNTSITRQQTPLLKALSFKDPFLSILAYLSLTSQQKLIKQLEAVPNPLLKPRKGI